MTHIIRTFFHFFIDNFPSLKLILVLFPFSLIWSFSTLYFAGYCKKKWKWNTGYTRKLFHFLIFFSAAFFQVQFKLQGLFILGWAVTIAVLFACLKGNGHILYEAIAREKDRPFRTKYILFSYIATFLGGVFSNILFGSFAVFGYAVTGVADAIAEPVGIKYGHHHYKVFSFDKKISNRSLEGSLAVFIASFIMIVLVSCFTTTYVISVPVIMLIAFLCTVVEGLSPGGFDNLLLQLIAGFLCSLWL